MTVTINGTGPIVADASGNVGIGTSSPAYLLDLSSSLNGTLLRGGLSSGILLSNYNGEGHISSGMTLASSGSWTARNTASADININAGSSGALVFYTNGGLTSGNAVNPTERMRINSSGYVTAPYQPAFFVGGGSSSITTTAGSVLQFNTASLDRTSSFNTSTYRFTAPVAGVYVFHAEIYTQNGGTYVSFCWRRNGTQLAIGAPNWTTGDNMINYRGTMSSFGDFTQSSTTMLNLALNDYIDIAVRTGANSVYWYPNHSWFMGYLLG